MPTIDPADLRARLVADARFAADIAEGRHETIRQALAEPAAATRQRAVVPKDDVFHLLYQGVTPDNLPLWPHIEDHATGQAGTLAGRMAARMAVRFANDATLRTLDFSAPLFGPMVTALVADAVLTAAHAEAIDALRTVPCTLAEAWYGAGAIITLDDVARALAPQEA
jgi:hypothetical protein